MFSEAIHRIDSERNSYRFVHAKDRIMEGIPNFVLTGLITTPSSPEVLYSAGLALQDRQLPKQAIKYYARALSVSPNSTSILSSLYYTLYILGKKGVLKQLVALVKSNPNPRAAINLGLIYSDLGNHSESARQISRAITIDPSNHFPYSKMAIVLLLAKNFTRAKIVLTRVLRIYPHWIEAKLNLAYLKELEGDLESSIYIYQDVLQKNPEINEARFNLAQCYLAVGEYNLGWALYEARWNANAILSIGQDFRLRRITSKKPTFSGQKCARLLIWGEQGLGDEIMFSSVIPETLESAREIIVRCDQRLVKIISRSFPSITVIPNSIDIEDHDYDEQIAMGSLPAVYRKTEQDFLRVKSYLKPDRLNKNVDVSRIRERGHTVIGLSWRSVNRDNGNLRSINIGNLLRCFRGGDFSFINLQYDFKQQDRVDVSRSLEKNQRFYELPEIDKLHDIEGVASLISHCDVVVSIGNTVGHLSGAIGTPTVILTPNTSNWRWRSVGRRSLWYESVIIISKNTNNEWDEIFPVVRRTVSDLLIKKVGSC